MDFNHPDLVEPEDRVDNAEVLYHAVRKREFTRYSETEVTISENAYSDSRKQPSVDRARINNSEPEHTRFRESDAIVSLIAEEVRAITISQSLPGGQSQPYVFDVIPRPEPDNPAHAQIEADRPLTSSPYKHLKMALAVMSKKRVELDPYEQVVSLTKSGEVYHKRSCHHLKNGRKPVAFKKVPDGVRACGQCQPEGWAPEEPEDGEQPPEGATSG